jgi:hypothetical protein
MKSVIFLLIILCLFGCGNEENEVFHKRLPDSTIHLSGDGGYWKNGVRIPLDNLYRINSMSVTDSLVLISGLSTKGSMIWQNGSQYLVSNISSGAAFSILRGKDLFGVWNTDAGWASYKNGVTTTLPQTGAPTGLGVIGEDLYVSGNAHGNQYLWQVSPFYHLDTYAMVWKNNQEFFRETVYSYANTMLIYGSNIYLGGHVNNYPSLNRVACYWKNGQRFILGDKDDDSQVNALWANGTAVYAAGEKNKEAVYWYEGTVFNLSGSVGPSVANSISVLQEDVYVAGREDNHPAVWKNGDKQSFPGSDQQWGEIRVIRAVSNWTAIDQ